MPVKISVIIPVYNAENYIEDCIKSVLSQTFSAFELLLVNDGSTDNSSSLIKKSAESDSRIRVIEKENGGAASARNRGFKEAAGEYIYFLDADDSIAPDALEKLYSEAEKNEADLVFFDAYMIKNGETSTDNYSHKEKYPPLPGKTVLSKMIANGDFHVAPVLLLIKRELLVSNSHFFTEGIVYEDCIFTYKLFYYAQKSVYLPEYLYYRLWHEGSVMSSAKSEKNLRSALTAFGEVYSFSVTNGIASVNGRFLARLAYNVINCRDAVSSDVRKAYEKEYSSFAETVKNENGFGDKALLLRLKSKALWAAYKAKNRFFVL